MISLKGSVKGSLSLSINAIVVLILAIAMLGLGLGFTRQQFSSLASKLEIPAPNIPATEQDPIALPSEIVEFDDNRNAEMAFNVYNDGSCSGGSCGFFIAGLLCRGTAVTPISTASPIPVATYSTLKIVVPKAKITARIGTSGQSKVCVLRVCEGANFVSQATCEAATPPAGTREKQIVIKVI